MYHYCEEKSGWRWQHVGPGSSSVWRIFETLLYLKQDQGGKPVDKEDLETY
jgi:hypothetical protein